jgi:6-pyruvoyltetrahydropterin/6-carboxytetrahydropterin synthase
LKHAASKWGKVTSFGVLQSDEVGTYNCLALFDCGLLCELTIDANGGRLKATKRHPEFVARGSESPMLCVTKSHVIVSGVRFEDGAKTSKRCGLFVCQVDAQRNLKSRQFLDSNCAQQLTCVGAVEDVNDSANLTIAAGCLGGVAHVWRDNERDDLRSDDVVFGVALHPHLPLVVSGSDDACAIVWWRCADRFERVDTLRDHADGVLSCAWSPDGSLLACGAFDGRINVYRCSPTDSNGRPSIAFYTSLPPHSNSVTALCFSPRSDVLASASADQTLRLYSTGSAAPSVMVDFDLSDHGTVDAVLFVADHLLLAGSENGSIGLFSSVARVDESPKAIAASSSSSSSTSLPAAVAALTVSPVVTITRRECFSAAHRLHSALLSDDENKRVYGKCNNANGHGHNYVVYVDVRGSVDRRTGMVMNLVDLKQAMRRVIEQLDHLHIDRDVAYFRDNGVPSTVENIAIFVWHRLVELLDKPSLLAQVRVHETENNVACFQGEHVEAHQQ